MISYQKYRLDLIGLPRTIASIERLDKLIDAYSANVATRSANGPAYVKFDHINMMPDDTSVQLDRDIMVNALQAQRARRIAYLEDIGIAWDPVPEAL